ncbi:MAG: pseudouridine synthase [Lachnospiraceae bacterium]|nr:pseudouridine synthase [Lachnospiraceae bacterium]
MFHKPSGCITAKSDETHKTVMEYFSKELQEELHPVGRLDKDTEGLLLFTNDGKWNQDLMHPENHVEKRYFFWVLGELNEEKRKQLEQGVFLVGAKEKTMPAQLKIGEKAELQEIEHLFCGKKCSNVVKNPRNHVVMSGYLTIKEGKKHQVKRMLKAVGCYVVYLKRVSIGKLMLDESLQPGEYRELQPEELKRLK